MTMDFDSTALFHETVLKQRERLSALRGYL